jgi:serine/threonine protein kinase
MTTESACPGETPLRAYLLGRIPDVEVEALERHLLACSPCAEELNRLTDHDSLFSSLAGDASPVEQCAPLVQQMISRFVEQPHAAASAFTSIPGNLLGDFRIVRLLGRGGMGVVYEAEQISLDRRVALKVLPFAATLDATQLQRFRNEAHAAASLHHPHIVPVYAIGCERGVHYYAMQFIDGVSLDAILARMRAREGDVDIPPTQPNLLMPNTKGPVGMLTAAGSDLPLLDPALGSSRESVVPAEAPPDPVYFRWVAEVGAQAAEALEHAHQVGVIHRDIKPANLLVTRELGPGRGGVHVWVTDFGLAHIRGAARLTLSGDLMGTPRYMSPEQIKGSGTVLDPRTDVYSLGVTLYELLTLRPAFAGEPMEALGRIDREEPQPPRKISPAVPVDLETIVLKAMAKAPAERYATVQDFAADLRRYLEDKPILARRANLLQRTRKWARRRKGVVIAAAVGLFALFIASTVGCVLVWRGYRAEAQQRERAQANVEVALHALDNIYLELGGERLLQDPAADQTERGILKQALEFYEQFAHANGSDARVRHEVARAYKRVGDIRRLLDRDTEADDAYQQAVSILQRLVADNPRESGHRAELADLYLTLGSPRFEGHLFASMGSSSRRQEAEEHLRQALAMYERLALDFPDNLHHRLGQARSLHALAFLLDAEEPVRRGAALCRTLVTAEPANHDFRRELVTGLNRSALIARNHRTVSDAEACKLFEEAIAEHQIVLRANPQSRRDQAVLFSLQTNLALTHLRAQQLGEADSAYRDAVRTGKTLTDRYPAVAEYRSILAFTCWHRANVLARLGRFGEAEGSLQEAATGYERLASDFPDLVVYRLYLGAAFVDWGEVLLADGKAEEARRTLEQAFGHAQAAARLSPENDRLREVIRDAQVLLVETLVRLRSWRQAAEAACELPALFRQGGIDYYAVTRLLTRAASQVEHENSLPLAERAALAKSYSDAAASIASQTRDKKAAAVKQRPTDPAALNDLAAFLIHCPDRRFRDPKQAVGLARKATDLAGQEGYLWITLGHACYRAGNWPAAQTALEKAIALRKGGDASEGLFMAMTLWQLSKPADARAWYDRTVASLSKDNLVGDGPLIGDWRVEAASVLGLEASIGAKPAEPR